MCASGSGYFRSSSASQMDPFLGRQMRFNLSEAFVRGGGRHKNVSGGFTRQAAGF
jgi:hypothetical protein